MHMLHIICHTKHYTSLFLCADSILGAHSEGEEHGAGHSVEVLQSADLQQFSAERHSYLRVCGHFHSVCAAGQPADGCQGLHITVAVLGRLPC